MTADRDKAPLSSVLGGLQADYPEWCFALRRCCDGLRLEAYRLHCPGGLYAMITADPAELRRELDSLPQPQSAHDHDVTGLTADELERTRRELQANLALLKPGSPAQVPILAHLSAIDAELAGRGSREMGLAKA